MTILSKDAPPEISHPAHPEHKLKLMATGAAEFQCDVCKELGAGDRYTCRPCDFDLHSDCALAEATLVHPLLKGREFQLRHEHPRHSDGGGRTCGACGGKVLGLHYHCAAKKGLDLHPCCAALPLVIPQEELTLELRKEASHRCSSCRERDRSRSRSRTWFYRSTCKTVYLHVACVKEIARRSRGAGVGSSIDPFASVKESALQIYRAKKDESELERVILELVLGG
ncbi:uncharacterized protein LOC123412231 [Hordeum vulgare subsp. vulgare]|uniref:DC1 domain-containing protein n=1 Tax=Hordeum vulgare subsp. vulgare TaxID=112509 RepID=A0A8I6Z674_HORVV|nr:uncharacterized protein LOC123412231 [Hordeum vulgare subsp. vulgare]